MRIVCIRGVSVSIRPVGPTSIKNTDASGRAVSAGIRLKWPSGITTVSIIKSRFGSGRHSDS